MIKNRHLIKELYSLILIFDPHARLVPGRFNPRRGVRRVAKLQLNINNKSEIFMKIIDRQFE
ncbi:MAG: hypothetical protein ACFFC7_34800 [Candidatus Hermodarchaeota archaeon]